MGKIITEIQIGLLAAFSASTALQAQEGKKLYEEHCGICHMMDGSGVPMMQPPLISSPLANGDKDSMIDIILLGSAALKRQSHYSNPMPPFAHLTDKTIAEIATYVRTHFENTASPVTADHVRTRRKQK